MDEAMIKKLNAALTVVVVAAAGVLLVSFLRSRNAEAPTETASDAPASAPAPGEATNADLAGFQEARLAEQFASWTPDGKLDETKTRTPSIVVEGEVAKAYLKARVSLGGKPLTKYESVYVKIGDAGGHLFRPMSLPVPADNAATALLFDLAELPVLPSVPYDETRVPEKADLKALLVGGKSPRLTAFVSSLRPALIEDMTLHYLCAEGQACSIRVQ